MKMKEIKDWLDRHDIDPVENMGGPGGNIYPFTEDELLEFILFIRDECAGHLLQSMQRIILTPAELDAIKREAYIAGWDKGTSYFDPNAEIGGTEIQGDADYKVWKEESK